MIVIVEILILVGVQYEIGRLLTVGGLECKLDQNWIGDEFVSKYFERMKH